MSPKRPPRRLLACAALSAGVLLGSGAASAETPRQPQPTARARLAALLDAALRVASTAPTTCERTDQVSLEPQCRMGNTKGPSYTDRAARAAVERAQPVQARPVGAQVAPDAAVKSAFELDWLGGAAEALLRRRRPGIDDLPWGSLDPTAYPASLLERARASWTEGAYNEYCSGAAFAELAAALLAARAPIDLVAMAGDFVVDEMLHVELNSRMAMELGGGALSLVDYQALVPRPAPSLDPLARASELVVRLSCVGESFTLPILIGCMRAAAHPLTRAVLSRLARDEVAHARFGWIYLDWVGDRLDLAERERLAAVAAEGLADYAAELAPAEGRAADGVTPEGFLVRHIHELGWMEASEYARLARRAVRDRVIARLARHRIAVDDPTLS